VAKTEEVIKRAVLLPMLSFRQDSHFSQYFFLKRRAVSGHKTAQDYLLDKKDMIK